MKELKDEGEERLTDMRANQPDLCPTSRSSYGTAFLTYFAAQVWPRTMAEDRVYIDLIEEEGLSLGVLEPDICDAHI